MNEMVGLISKLIQSAITPEEFENVESEIAKAENYRLITDKQQADLVWELYYTRNIKNRQLLNIAFGCGTVLAWLVTSIGFIIGFLIF